MARNAGVPTAAQSPGRARTGGLVRPGLGMARGRHESALQELIRSQSALPDDPALCLARSAVEPAAVFRCGLGTGDSHEAMAPPGGVAKFANHLRSSRLARAH